MEPQPPPGALPAGLVGGAAAWGAAAACLQHAQLAAASQAQMVEMQWRCELQAKLSALISALNNKFSTTQNICLCQTWLGADGCESATPGNLEVTLWADPRLGVVLDPLFNELRIKSCQAPVFFRNSMPGKVWRSGAVQIVQNLRILPPTLHPRSQLSDEALERMAEALYIPIYDLLRPAKGQVCVLEVLLSSRATEAMLVADVISFIGGLLTVLQLSLANPVQQPVRRSVLCGRRARAADSDGEASDGEGGARGSRQLEQQQQQQQPAAQLQAAPAQQQGAGAAAAAAAASQSGREAAPGSAPLQQPQLQAAHGPEGGGAAVAARAADPRLAAAADAHADAVARGGAPGASACGTRPSPDVPAASEQPTHPASPDLGTTASDAGAAGAAPPPAAPPPLHAAPVPPHPAAAAGGGANCSVPRKVRKVLDGPMQRSRSVVSVPTLGVGRAGCDDEDEDGQAYH